MFNKKRIVAMAMTSAMIMASMAGCSKSESASTTATDEKTSASADASTDAPSEAPSEEATTAPDAAKTEIGYKVEAGKVVDFEDGNFGFVLMNTQTPVSDLSELSVVDFNGSKALKVTPKKNDAGMSEFIGFDVTSLLGAKVADAKSVKMQIGVESKDGKFHACGGTIFQNFSDASGNNWVTYTKSKNPNEVGAEFSKDYDASQKNVMVISKFPDAGNNSDTAWSATGEYSSLYIDNIVFFDADGNPIDVDSTVAFDAPDGFGDADWSNLIKVTDQTIIPGFAAEANGWAQAPDWILNKHMEEQPVAEKDEDGNEKKDEEGNVIYVQKKDENGEPMVNEDGEPVYETEEVEVGQFDWASIMKPGTVFTMYYSAEESEDLNHYIWWVMQAPDFGLKWNRLLDAPTAAGKPYKIQLDTPLEEKKGMLWTLNDSHNMAQATYEEIMSYIENVYANNDKILDADGNPVGMDQFSWEGNFGFQAEAGMAWKLSAVTYSLDQEY